MLGVKEGDESYDTYFRFVQLSLGGVSNSVEIEKDVKPD